ncbi:MAG: hypothetical protein JW967_02385 [Dehalococcoidales bacterium]|nr:hypothetical protein [Dehalococcoidales bacterium]
MKETLKDVDIHSGSPYASDGTGHYEADVESDGSVIITIVYDKVRSKPIVTLSSDRWDRLVAWVEWQRRKDLK